MMKIMMDAMSWKMPDIDENTLLLAQERQTFPERFRLGPKIRSPCKPDREEATNATVNWLIYGVGVADARSTNG
jgi:hypothetical protein